MNGDYAKEQETADAARSTGNEDNLSIVSLIVDYVVSVKRNAGLLICLGLLSSALGLLAAYRYPSPFVSTAVLEMGEDGANAADAIMRTPTVLDAVAARFPDLTGATAEEKRRVLNEKFQLTWPNTVTRPKATVFFLNVRDADPKRAQSLALALLDVWIDVSKPRPDTKVRLEADLERAQSQYDGTNLLIQQYEREAKVLLSPNSLQGEVARPLVELIAKRESLMQLIIQKKDSLRGVSRDVVVGQPTLPAERGQRWAEVVKAMAGGLALLFAGLGYLLAKLLWRTWLSAHPMSMSKLNASRWGFAGD